MRRTGRWTRAAWVAAVVWLSGAVLVGGPTLASPDASLEDSEALLKTAQLAQLINQVRVEQGRLPLARSAALDTAADQHSRDMADQDFLEHEGSDGSTPQERAEQAGYDAPLARGGLVVELISAISDQPDGPLRWWLDEAPATHGKHLRDPRYHELGVGYAVGGTYGNYWTVLVGCRPGIQLAIDVEGVTYHLDGSCQVDRPPPDAPADPPIGRAAGTAAQPSRTAGW